MACLQQEQRLADPDPDVAPGDQLTDVTAAPNGPVRMSDLPAPATAASFVNCPQGLMQRLANARLQGLPGCWPARLTVAQWGRG